MSILARALFIATLPMAWAETPTVTLQARMEATGEITIRTSSPLPGLAAVLSDILRCEGGIKSQDDLFGEFRCRNAMRRDGLALEAVFDLAPLAQKLQGADEIQLRLDYPRLGFDASSTPLHVLTNDEGARSRRIQTAQFRASALPVLIRVQFGYHLGQLAAIYLPLAALALALVLIAMTLSRWGLAELIRSAFLLGTMFWLAAASWLQAADPLRILLSGTPLANLAAVLAEYCLPLLCVAAGAALGGTKRTDRRPTEIFGDVFWGCGMFVFPLASALSAIPSMAGENWVVAAPALVAAPISILVCRWRIRARTGTTVRQLSGGELKGRVSELAARAGRHNVKVYISSSTRTRVFNALALQGDGILLTAPLVQGLAKREVDAVVAHELSHLGHARRSLWAALAMAAVFIQTPLSDLLFPGAAGVSIALLVSLIMFFAALFGSRRREFAADSGSAALTGDPRAMISALARISRHNGRPLELNTLAEWFSTHPSTHRRIRMLAGAGRVTTTEVEALCHDDDPGESYTLPPDDGGTVFTLAWQNSNATRYVCACLLAASGAGLLVAGLLNTFARAGAPQLAAGIVLGCAFTKFLAATVMSTNYARLSRKLASKLGAGFGAGGQLVGFALDSEPRVYNGFRFSDAGFLSFESGRLCFRSERATIRLNPADVVEVGMVAAAPSTWRRLQPMVRFHHHESGNLLAFILHPVGWGASPRRLLRSLERWRATQTSLEPTLFNANAVAGRPFDVPTIAQTARGFRIPGTVTLVGAILAGWFLRPESWPGWYALIITACAYAFLYLPALLYRPSSRPTVLARVDAE